MEAFLCQNESIPMSAKRVLILLPVLLLAGLLSGLLDGLLAQDPRQVTPPQGTPEDTLEVRIRSGAYSPLKPTIVVDANLVELGVIVRNRQGQPAGGFKETDFELTDSGKPQTITFFSERKSTHGEAASSAPATRPSGLEPAGAPAQKAPRGARYIAMFFDDTHTEGMTLQKGRDAARKFLSEGVQPGDHVGIFTGSARPVADFTADIPALLGVLDQLKPHAELYQSRSRFVPGA